MIKGWQAALVIIPSAVLYRLLILGVGRNSQYVLGNVLLWVLIIVCTILILNKIESLKTKDDDEEKGEETTP